ncbi:L-dopachrome tautomerase-related protein [Streptomyces sp. NPDC057052]|uniref:L-dopachrome tautomerase-related protein n=1 Tax=Streptomyces sp. NPDC057052 TaxID=3346010 RepID=UPI00363011F7
MRTSPSSPHTGPNRRSLLGLSLAAGATLAVGASPAVARSRPPASRHDARLQTVATFQGAMPTGVTVSRTGRVFVSFPRWGDDVSFSVAEIRGGKAVAYPNPEVNRPDINRPSHHFLGVQSVVVDAAERLWVVDTGRIEWADALGGGPKLVAVDLATDKVVRTIVLPPSVAGPRSFVNDVRFDLTRGYAYLTDATPDGPNGLIVVHLATGTSWRCLDDAPAVRPVAGFVPTVEGRPMLNHPDAASPATPLNIGADGIALSPGGEWLYFCPLSSRRLYAVRTVDLIRPGSGAMTSSVPVHDLGVKGMSDGLETDEAGRVYGGDLEDNAIVRRGTDGSFHTLVRDDRLVWADTLSVGYDRHLYVIANQLNRQAAYNGGVDLRVKPYGLYRFPVGSGPARR